MFARAEEMKGTEPGRRMYGRCDFPMNTDTRTQLIEILKNANDLERTQRLSVLRDRRPQEALDAIIELMHSPDQALRRRAANALSWFREHTGAKAAALADMLQHHADDRVRLSCAIQLMSVQGPAVDQAFLATLKDPFDKVAQIACLELGSRVGSQAADTNLQSDPQFGSTGTEALFSTLGHALWRVRFEACKSLIALKKADARVMAALEALSREPEAAVYDAECDEPGLEMAALVEFGKAAGILLESEKDELAAKRQFEPWGKMHTIIARAREIASSHADSKGMKKRGLAEAALHKAKKALTQAKTVSMAV